MRDSLKTFAAPNLMNASICRRESAALFRMSSKIVVIICNLSHSDFNSLGYRVRSAESMLSFANDLIACDLHFSIAVHRTIPLRCAASHLRWFSTIVLTIALIRCRMPIVSLRKDFWCAGLSLTEIAKNLELQSLRNNRQILTANWREDTRVQIVLAGRTLHFCGFVVKIVVRAGGKRT